MRYPRLLAIAAVLLARDARADLTIHYKTSYQLAPGLPASITDAMKQQLAASLPEETTIQIQGERVATHLGKLICIIDYGKQQITLLHPGTKRYATTATTDFAKQAASLISPEARQAMDAVKVDVKGVKSGKTALVRDVPVEENVVTMTMEGGAPGSPSQVQVRMEMHHWMATAEALQRFPELKQWNVQKWNSAGGFNPADLISGSFTPGPSAEKLRAAMQDLMKENSGLALKSETRMFMPPMMQMMQAQGITLGDGPMISTVMEMDRFTTDPVPASVFAVPADYQAVPLADLIQELNPAKPSANRLIEERPPLTGPVHRAGGGVTAPRVKKTIQPTYTPEARSAGIEGDVTLYAVVETDGYVRDVRVLQSLDPGLDRSAIDCVKHWVFEPGVKDSEPVNVEVRLGVNFRLRSPTQH
ncbi:MAG TPA: energy transducer TonB [Candidatus Acidoferrum sp.]|nr:energy transducer TonB [Candidatus Acidoferrum sp.]